jgi:hypothetical protein
MDKKKIGKGVGILAADIAIIVGGASLINNGTPATENVNVIPTTSPSAKNVYYVNKPKNDPTYSVVLNPAQSNSSATTSASAQSNTQPSASAQPTASAPSASATPTQSQTASPKPTLVTQTIYPILPPPPVSGVTSASGSTYTPPPSGGGGTPTPRPTRTPAPSPRPTHVEQEGNDH